MAYRNSYNYKGGSKKVRDSRRVKRGLRIAGRTVLWLFIGMLVAHLIFSVASRSSSRLAELDSEGIAPITTRRDEVNAELAPACWCGGSFTDSYKTDRLIAMLKRKGITKAVLDLKPESGILAYDSGVQTAIKLGAVPEGVPELDRILVKFSNAGIGVIARISLYIDDAAATDVKHCAVESQEVTETETDDEGNTVTVVKNKKIDVIWNDKNGHAWRSPFDSGAVEYASELIAELGAGGVEAVLIDNVRFPTVSDGDEGNVVFPEEEEAGMARAGAVRQNIAALYAAAHSAGIKLCVALDGHFCCGEQDSRAGITFNVYGLNADIICPIAVLSRFERDGVSVVGTYEFTDAQSADMTQLFEAFCSGVRMMQGAVDEPPANMPVIQAYSDSATGLEFTPETFGKQTEILDKCFIRGRIAYGAPEELDRLLPDADKGETAEPAEDAEPGENTDPGEDTGSEENTESGEGAE